MQEKPFQRSSLLNFQKPIAPINYFAKQQLAKKTLKPIRLATEVNQKTIDINPKLIPKDFYFNNRFSRKTTKVSEENSLQTLQLNNNNTVKNIPLKEPLKPSNQKLSPIQQKNDYEESFKKFDFIIRKRQQKENYQPVAQKPEPFIPKKHPIYQEKELENFEVGKVLGLGSYAIVKFAVHKATGLEVAIKSYNKKKLQDPIKSKNVQREISILQKLDHTNIIKIYNVLDSENSLHLIMEYLPYIPLSDYLRTKKFLGEAQARYLVKQIASALTYCHKKNVVHRDIKPENVLISKEFKVKIIDFGFAVLLSPGNQLNVFCGTPTYMAPEIINKSNYSFPVDVWALGVLIYKILTLDYPFRGNNDKDLFRKINSGIINFPFNFSLELKNLLTEIFQQQSKNRITFEQILKSEWVIGI